MTKIEKAIQVTGKKGEIPSRHAVNKMLSQVYSVLAGTWHQTMRPKHFTNAAYSAYGFRPRSTKYNKRKTTKLPLVFSGQGRQSTESARIQGTRNGGRAIMPGARVFNFTPKGWDKPLRDELLRTNAAEKQEFERIARRLLREMLTSKAKIRVKLA